MLIVIKIFDKLKIIPLGGLLEIGKNITVFEYENDIYVVSNNKLYKIYRPIL